MRCVLLLACLASISPAQSTVCAECHQKIWQSYQKTGMARSFYRAQEVAGPTFYHAPSDIYYANIEHDSRAFQKQYQIGFDGRETNARETAIDYVLGSGNHARSFLHRNPNGTLIQLPLGWYAEKGGVWAMNPGYDRPDHQALGRKITYDCMFCHNAYPQIPTVRDPRAAPIFSSIPEGIDCQRCHGDGQKHRTLARSGAKLAEIRAAIVNPSRLAADRQLEVCMQCHLETTSSPLPASIVRYERQPFSFQPGEPLADFMLHFDHKDRDDKFEITGSAYRLQKSQCFQKSNGALKCTTCHDPHDATPKNYTQICKQCHAGLERIAAHPTSADCVGCHMPKRRTDDVVHAVMTDHWIQRRKPSGDLIAAKPETETPPYRGEVVLYYPRTLPKPEDELYLSIAQVVQSSNLTSGIPRLESALARFRPAAAEYYLQLGDAWSNAGKFDRALPVYEEAAKRDPAPALLRLAICQNALRQYPRAVETLNRALKLAPQNATAWIQLGLAQLGQGKTTEALQAFEQAQHADPDLPEPYNLRGAILFETGDRPRAESALRDALRIQPNFAPAHNNLGNLLSETGRFPEAEYHFKAALRYQANYPGARYNYALALNRVHRIPEAEAQLEAILKVNPDSAEAHEFLGNLLTTEGQSQQAIEHYRQALTIAPDFDQANLSLGSALAKAGNKEAALKYLQKASRSADPAIRTAAERLSADVEKSLKKP
jgi:tetratricopeptide (TPR) repeat protein